MREKEVESVVCDVLRRMRASGTMNLALATRLMDHLEAEAARMGVKAVVAIFDAAGRPVAVHCMDGAYIGSYDVAVCKAYTAVAFQMSTAELGRLAAPGGPLYGIQNTNDGKIVIFGGGEPLFVDGVMIGAIGVSGGTAEQDTELGAYVKNIVKEVIDWK
ncbi:MAG: GlcG/HbpS family heme-binding protein [Roseburia sp.]